MTNTSRVLPKVDECLYRTKHDIYFALIKANDKQIKRLADCAKDERRRRMKALGHPYLPTGRLANHDLCREEFWHLFSRLLEMPTLPDEPTFLRRQSLCPARANRE